jgi:hypothetical protein
MMFIEGRTSDLPLDHRLKLPWCERFATCCEAYCLSRLWDPDRFPKQLELLGALLLR